MRTLDCAAENQWSLAFRIERMRHGMTLNEVANFMNVTPVAVLAWEQGTAAPSTFARWNSWSNLFNHGHPINPPPYEEIWVDRLVKARAEKQISNAVMARMLFIHSANFCHWESRRNFPSSFTLWNRWAEVLDLPQICNDPPELTDADWEVLGEC